MQDLLDRLLVFIDAVPVETVYVLVGAGAAVENLFPPIPSDTFVVLGGVLSDRGVLRWEIVLAVAWGANFVMGCFVYAMGRRYGRAIFDTSWGAWLLRPHQLERMSRFYESYGTLTILVSRFFPVFRVLVPAFAGISRLRFWRMALPLGLASAVWYAVLLWAGVIASRNVPRLVAWVETANVGLLAGAGVLALGVFAWWWRTRRQAEEEAEEAREEAP